MSCAPTTTQSPTATASIPTETACSWNRLVIPYALLCFLCLRFSQSDPRVILTREQPMPTAVKPLPIHDFVTQLRKFPERSFDQTEQLRKFLQDAPVDSDSLPPYLTGDRQHYTRNLIDKTPLYELLAICWEVGQASSVHNHRDQNCWMSAPIGRLHVENFHLVSQDVDHGRSQLTPTDIVEMNSAHPCAVNPADPVHRVVNPTTFGERAVSL